MLASPSSLLLEHERRRRHRLRLPLSEFVPSVSPTLVAPVHLAPLVNLFERVAAGEEVRAVVSTPPQHGKSVTALHALCWLLARDPTRRHAYATYAQQFARDQNTIARPIAQRAGVRLTDVSADRWRTSEGGRIAWTGVGGPLTGQAIDGLLLADDLLKNRQEAESATHRDRIMGWLYGVGLTRVHPGGSVILIATRWHPRDPSGQLIEAGWEEVNLPAVNHADEALWPDARPREWLEQRKAELSEYDWWSLYMGRPRPRGGAVFKGAHLYDDLPDGGYQEAHGFDAAYSTHTRSDYSVTLTGRKHGDTLYVTRMIRDQLEARHYLAKLQAVGVKRVAWYRGGTEKGLEAMLEQNGIRVRSLPVSGGDKFVRAQHTAQTWNDGRILLPKNEPWVEEFLDEMLAFTGTTADRHDDIVDALAALHDDMFNKDYTDIPTAERAYI